MFNFLLKMLLCPGIIFIADALSPAINYSSSWHVIITGVFVGVIGYVMDSVLLINVGSEMSAIMDTVAATIVVYLSQFFFTGTVITLLGALLGGVLLGLSEYLTHRLILGDGYRERRRGI